MTGPPRPCPPEPPSPTAEQAAAVAARERDLLLEAGAGTGKTRVLVDRYCAAITEDGAGVEEILAFTVTERSAAELRRRVRAELSRRACEARSAGDSPRAAELRRAARDTERAWVTTIHGFCRRLLATHPVAAGLDPRFRVLDASESTRLRDRAARAAVDALLSAGDEEVSRAAAAYRWRLAEMAVALHERLRSLGQAEPSLPAAPEPSKARRENGEDLEPLSPTEAESARAAHAGLRAVLEEFRVRYDQLKAERSGLDFADLELRALGLLRASEPVRAAWQGRFRHVMVDEFQDTNRVQLDLVEILRGPETAVFRVGDEHQSIYRFRNADLAVFRAERSRAQADPGTDVLPLRGNFRSTRQVLGTVNLIGRTLLDEFGELTAERGETGPESELLLTLDEGAGRDARNWRGEGIEIQPPPSEDQPAIVAEARFLARRLRALADAGEASPGDMVVLLRAFTHVDAYEEALRRAGLDPYVVGGRGYWSQQQVEDMIRLCGVVANPLDDEMLFGALASPASGVSPDALWLLRRAATDEESDRHFCVWPVLNHRYGGGEAPPHPVAEGWLDHVPAEDAARLRSFCATLARLRAEAPIRSLDDLVERTMTEFGYDLELLARPGGPGRMANVRKLIRLAAEYEEHEGRDLRAFLAAAAESTRRDEREGMAPVRAEDHDGVRIMTVHAAKGLEFPVVAVPDLGRKLDAGHRWGDVAISSVPEPGAVGEGATTRFGMRLVFPAAPSFGLWELDSLLAEERAAEAEEGCRLVYVAASRARDRLILSGTYKPSMAEALDEAKPSDSPLRRLLPALSGHGWDGGEGTIRLPARRRVTAEAGAAEQEVGIGVRLSEPSPERAEWLREELPPAARPEGTAAPAAPPPLLPTGPRAVPAGHLSYSALADFERCGYRFYAERVLGLRPLPPAGADVEDDEANGVPEREGDELIAPEEDGAGGGLDARARRLALGNAVHGALEWSAKRGWSVPPTPFLESLLAQEAAQADAELTRRASRLVEGWLQSRLRTELEGLELRPEAPFVLGVAGTVVRGKIDLIARAGDDITVIDFKTDALRGSNPQELSDRYAVQRAIYALAVAGDAPAGRLRAVHCFLEAPDEPVEDEFDGPALDAARARLEQLVGMIRGGSFAPTTQPYPALCFGCPAAARLCPNPAWRPPGRAHSEQLALMP